MKAPNLNGTAPHRHFQTTTWRNVGPKSLGSFSLSLTPGLGQKDTANGQNGGLNGRKVPLNGAKYRQEKGVTRSTQVPKFFAYFPSVAQVESLARPAAFSCL